MRLGFLAGSVEEKEFRFAAENGFECLEFNGAPGRITRYKDSAKQLKDWSEQYKIGISSFGYFGAEYFSDDEETRTSAKSDADAALEICRTMEAPVFVIGCGERPVLKKSKWHTTYVTIDVACRRAVDEMSELVKKAESAGIKVAFYNCDWGNFAYNESAWGTLLYAFPNAGIKFDPSHPFYRGEDYLGQLSEWAHRIYHVHAKGSLQIKGKRFTDPPPGLDQTDWRSMFAILYKAGYQGDVNLEPHSPEWGGENRERGLLIGRDYLKPILDPLG